MNHIRKYFTNCFLLTVPILVWDMAFANLLPRAFQPEIFWENIDSFLTYGENISRILIFAFTLIMPLSISTAIQRKGLAIYAIGILLYFGSWLLMIYLPDSLWSNSVIGFTSPAYSPLIWLLGIGLIGNSFYFNLPFRRWLFTLTSIIFLVFHITHTYTIYLRTH